MSIFSIIKKSKEAAKQHKEQAGTEQNQQKKSEKETAKVPYKHVPTHAAIDALSGAPSSWKKEDRSKIREHHRRRSQMSIAGTDNAVSTLSYLNSTPGSADIPSVSSIPRNSSYNTYNPTWNNRGDMSQLMEPAKHHRRYMSKGHSHTDSGIGRSPLSSNFNSHAGSSVASSSCSNNSTSSSSDNLEMAAVQAPPRLHERAPYLSYKPQPMVFEEKDIFSRLHTSTTRKVGEEAAYETPPGAPLVPKIPDAFLTAQEEKRFKKLILAGKQTSEAIAI